MNKIRKRSYRGIEYIRLSDLSEELRSEISNWLSDEVLIKIMTENGIQRNCIQLKDFIHWYDNLYTPLSGVQDVQMKNPNPGRKKLSLVLEG